jgi:hypothetical protein
VNIDHSLPDLDHFAGRFVSQRNRGSSSAHADDGDVRPADSAGTHADQHVVLAWLRDLNVSDIDLPRLKWFDSLG